MNPVSALRWLRLLAPAATFAGAFALGLHYPPSAPAPSAADLDRQLALADAAHDRGSLRELARRIARLDPSVAQQLRLARLFLAQGMYDDAAAAIISAERRSATPLAAAEVLHAQIATAHQQWPEAVRYWSEALASPPDPHDPGARRIALDGIVDAFFWLGDWPQARTWLDERLAFADDRETRRQRALVLLRLHDWPGAGRDFAWLRQHHPSDASVRELLPLWERVERARDELIRCDAAVEAGPDELAPRVTRAFAALRAGLAQNASDDFAFIATHFPEARTPLLAGFYASRIDNEPRDRPRPYWWPRLRQPRRVAHSIPAKIGTLPILAPSLFAGQFAGDPSTPSAWLAMAACDEALARRPDPVDAVELRTQQAEIELQLGFTDQALADIRALPRAVPRPLAADKIEIACLIQLQRWIEADAAVTAAIQANQSPDGRLDGELGRLAGLIWQQQGKHADAVRVLTAYLDEKRTPELLRARAKSLRFLQRFDEARADDEAARAMARAAHRDNDSADETKEDAR